MASSFKNARAAATASYATVYTCPGSTTAIVIGCQVANIHATDAAAISLQWLDSSNSNAATRLAEQVSLPVKTSMESIPNKLVLEAGDVIQIRADAVSKAEISVSVLEIT